MDINTLMGLKNLVCGEEEEEESMVRNQNPGSVLNPGDIDSTQKKTALAKPHAKLEIVKGEKPEPVVEQKKPQVAKPKVNKNDIWTEEEIKDLPIIKNDQRQRPEFD
jgi:hypothetical protein